MLCGILSITPRDTSSPLRCLMPASLADLGRGPQRLMRAGITLIVLGHVNFILGAIVHGTVLRHVANPERTVTSEYTAANVISVGSGLLSITAGIVAILVSRNLRKAALHWALLCVSLLNCLLSAACSLGLALAISLTIASRGHRLIVGCNSSALPADARAAIPTNDCPFDTTRIYDTALALWFPSMVMAVVEAVLSGRCCVVSLILRGVGPCADTYIRQQLEQETATKEVASEDQHKQELCQLLAVEDGART
ncbi:keratinocyte-associated protein 3 isoform X1 [Gopherus flavomarginatus]|uniref:keratinocyte-associated protein 3 isoform X1 n=2 Tax=Gopherus flavomarginatus TaxID=286002 RepID=UPI0021CB9B78|nr:keratinocyte-associated protein 3 isoform X1 [Gopherus flavomarginatus]